MSNGSEEDNGWIACIVMQILTGLFSYFIPDNVQINNNKSENLDKVNVHVQDKFVCLLWNIIFKFSLNISLYHKC